MEMPMQKLHVQCLHLRTYQPVSVHTSPTCNGNERLHTHTSLGVAERLLQTKHEILIIRITRSVSNSSVTRTAATLHPETSA